MHYNGTIKNEHLTHELFTDVPFTTKTELLNACRDGKTAINVNYFLGAKCVERLTETRGENRSLLLKVACIDERPSTVVERVKLRCPPGYWVERTTKQEFTFEYDPARPPNLTNMCVPQGTMAGGKACPFIFTQDESSDEWLAQGTILTYHNGKATERTQSQELTAFAGSVLIREIDPETSYIDSLSVILFYPDGSKAVLEPNLPELQTIDGAYFTTDQGDEVEIGFEEPADWNFDRAEITAHGYYEPY